MTTEPTLQQQVNAAMRDNHLRETRQQAPNPAMRGYRNLSGETIARIHTENQGENHD